MNISIIICCYNSASRLPETIKHIGLQKVQKSLEWEVIVVNNNSSDNTSEVAETEAKKYDQIKDKFRIVDEPKPGLSFARQKGVNESKFEVILFCDDDNWLDESYIQIAYDIMSKNEKIGALGGQGEAVGEVAFPDWWEDYMGGYAVGKQGEKTGDISERKYLWGSGLCLRKSLFIEIFNNLPSLLTDRKGDELTSGGDSEICMRILAIGYILYYDERLTYKHFITANRLTWQYRKKMFDGFTSASPILSSYALFIDIQSNQFSQNLKIGIRALIKIIVGCLIRKSSDYYQKEVNQLYFMGLPIATQSEEAKQVYKVGNQLRKSYRL